MSMLDITPTTPRNPFAKGAALPATVETQNSMYVITDTPWMVGSPGEVVVSCITGTFAGDSWRVPIEAVVLTRSHLHVGGIGLRTTRPLKVNGYPVETWDIPLTSDQPEFEARPDLVDLVAWHTAGRAESWARHLTQSA